MNRYKFIDQLEVKDVRPFERFMHEQFDNQYPELLDAINENYELDDDLIDKLKATFDKLLEEYQVNTYGR